MITVNFLNVGQGDSIILEWLNNKNEKSIGIIDSNLHLNGNPVLNYIRERDYKKIDFILLTHLHVDHFSGFSEVLNYCKNHKIEITNFLHTLNVKILDLLDSIIMSQSKQKKYNEFMAAIDDVIDTVIINWDEVTSKYQKINLNDDIELSFMAPTGRDYYNFAKAFSRKKGEIVKANPDLNSLSTIIKIKKGSECVMLTSDAVKESFNRISKGVTENICLIQVPHHGSIKNIDNEFWKNLKHNENCPAVFSVGYELKDKLPNLETVKFIHQNGYNIFSTNRVFGIAEFLGQPDYDRSISSDLDIFSMLTKTTFDPEQNNIQDLDEYSKVKEIQIKHNIGADNYSGNQVFELFK